MHGATTTTTTTGTPRQITPLSLGVCDATFLEGLTAGIPRGGRWWGWWWGGGAAIGFFQAGEAVSPPMSQLKRACAKDGNAPANREEVAGVAVALLGNCSPDARRSQFSYPLPTPPRPTPTHTHPAPRRA